METTPIGTITRNMIKDNAILADFLSRLRAMLQERATMVSFIFLLFVLLLGIFGPSIAPYQYDNRIYSAEGGLLDTAPPSIDHPLGTTDDGYDVLSRILYGARPTVITGLLGGSLIISIGALIGITAGYVGGKVDAILMRFTDIMYGIPLLPFAILLIALLNTGFIQSIVVIGLILWRGNARVLRAQVLQIKERPYVMNAKAVGASTPRIVISHILPNITSMLVFFFALGIGYSIVLQASLAFIGVANPFIPSWGIMVRNAYRSGLMGKAWWWSLPPGFLISLTVMFTYMFGRGYENISGEGKDEAFAQAG